MPAMMADVSARWGCWSLLFGPVAFLARRFRYSRRKGAKIVKRLPILLAVLLLVLVIMAGPMHVTAAGDGKAFRVDCLSFPQAPEWKVDHFVFPIPAVCTGTHVGRSVWFSNVTVFLDPTDPTGTPAPQYGDMVFIAADGSQLFGHFEGENVARPGGGFDLWGTYEIVGGTDRFVGASGGGSYYGGGVTNATLIWEGELVLP